MRFYLDVRGLRKAECKISYTSDGKAKGGDGQ